MNASRGITAAALTAAITGGTASVAHAETKQTCEWLDENDVKGTTISKVWICLNADFQNGLKEVNKAWFTVSGASGGGFMRIWPKSKYSGSTRMFSSFDVPIGSSQKTVVNCTRYTGLDLFDSRLTSLCAKATQLNGGIQFGAARYDSAGTRIDETLETHWIQLAKS